MSLTDKGNDEECFFPPRNQSHDENCAEKIKKFNFSP